MADYKLPDVGEGLTEAEIVSWKVKVGDVIDVNDVVVEIETAKSLVELPSPYAGTITALLVKEGEMVEVGTVIITIGDDAPAAAGNEAPAQSASSPSGGNTGGSPPAGGGPPPVEMDLSNPAASGGGEGESLVGRNKADRGAVRRSRRAAAPDAASAAATQQQLQGAFGPGPSPEVEGAEEPAVPASPARPEETSSDAAASNSAGPDPARSPVSLAKPPVRKLAKDLGVDLASLEPTGPGGVVTRADVESAATSSGSKAIASGSDDVRSGERETREPVKGLRKMMAEAMVGSAFSAPHVTEWVTVDATATMEFVERLKKRREFRDVKVSPLLVLARAVILAIRRTPQINSWWDEQAQEVVYKHYVNLGIAAATPRGLVVPNVKGAESLSLLDLAGALGELTATAREGRTQPAEMADGSFTITNVGPFGIDGGTPIINPGESAILCFGAVRKRPWVLSRQGADEIVVRQVTTLALSFDHRHIDGELGSRFLADVAEIIEDPASALLY